MGKVGSDTFEGRRVWRGYWTPGPMPPEVYDQVKKLVFYFSLVVLCLFGLLLLRLWFLQLVKGDEFAQKSESNRIRIRDLPPWRGMIFDRRGEILVNNRPSYDAFVVLDDIGDPKELARLLGRILKLNPLDVLTRIMTEQQDKVARTIRIKSDLTWEELALLETYKYELPGVVIQMQPKREYRPDSLACHLIGYLGEISEAQLKSGKFPRNKMGDEVGRCGVELVYNDYLTGQRGYRRVEVDALGQELGILEQVPSSPGANLYLTIDARLQAKAEELLADKVGAIVVLEAHTGRVLALASAPKFNQNAFSRGVDPAYWRQLLQDKDHPLENRAVKGQYPPGSTFKLVMAVAALEEKVVNPKSVFYCNGSFPFGNHVFRCHKRGGHGGMNLHSGLVHSCDVYFYNVGLRLGVDRIAKWSHLFGLGQVTGIKLESEKPGLIPTTAWKRQRFKQPWHEGETVSVAIGQGYVTATPLQMARVAAAIANGGVLYVPQIVEQIKTPEGEVLQSFRPEVAGRLPASPKTLELVRQACRDVVVAGTGKAARVPGVEVGGKTGTAQVVGQGQTVKKGRKTEDHAWFVCFAPVEKAEIAVAVIVEHSGHGGAVAAPIAREIVAAYFATKEEVAGTENN